MSDRSRITDHVCIWAWNGCRIPSGRKARQEDACKGIHIKPHCSEESFIILAIIKPLPRSISMRIRKELCMTKIQAVLLLCFDSGLPCNLDCHDDSSGGLECILVLFICHFFFFIIGSGKVHEGIHHSEWKRQNILFSHPVDWSCT